MRPILHQVRVPSLPRRLRPWPSGPSAVPATGWIVNGGALSFTEGSATPFAVSGTGPSGAVAGGVYGVDASGNALPTGMALTEAGSLTVGSATAQVQTGVVFTYTEPGALPMLTLYNNAVTGTLPYMATVYPLEGVVPAGQVLVSPDDTTLRSSVLSAWPDGSAQVVVCAGNWNFAAPGATATVRVRAGASSGAALTTAAIGAAVSSIAVNFGGGVQPLSSFGSPDWIWWANAQVICARYRLACGLGAMEAVIDVHAFAGGRAFVEVVIENGKVNADAPSVTGVTSQAYTNATVSVNGTTIATVSSPTVSMAAPNSRKGGFYAGGHDPHRAWYCSGWVGGDPQVEVTHDAAHLQAHPWFWKPAVASSENLLTKYAQPYDSYVPWSLGRLRIQGMDGTGSDEEIAMHTMCQCDYFLFGNRYARRAVLATGLALLSADVNWRHTGGSVPTRAQMAGKTQTNGLWPALATNQLSYGGDNTHDGSHIPSVALVPFLCRPSPCFIELAQKETCWNQANFNPSFDGSHYYDQTRSRGWRLRNAAIAIFLTPDTDAARKAGYRSMLRAEIDRDLGFLAQPWNVFKYLYDPTVDDPSDASGSRARSQGHWFMHHYVTHAWQHMAMVKVLRGADQTVMESAADDIAAYPLRWFSDAQSYEWRAVPYQPTVGVRVGNTLDMSGGNLVTYTAEEMGNARPSAPGSWLQFGPGDYNWPITGESSAAGFNYGEGTYPSWYFNAICAVIERGVSGADAAWTKIYGTNGSNGGIPDLLTWRNGMSVTPTWNRWPRNK